MLVSDKIRRLADGYARSERLRKEAHALGPSLIVASRTGLGFSQEQLAVVLGCTPFHLCKVERGRVPASLRLIARLHDVIEDNKPPSESGGGVRTDTGVGDPTGSTGGDAGVEGDEEVG